ncbi:hypothetical protein GP486_000721 [Trichoglossum hirsutum]|uniref:Mitochondrial thiamine pyrophosphate carrier 1 n=1 Tax=Trichoglossum hirsutum TaxID=265104 RepID=A0A9P8RTD9_9PEZI|nr:hypothetical protein GP486_000721 [Trichoglossum hirsutum]
MSLDRKRTPGAVVSEGEGDSPSLRRIPGLTSSHAGSSNITEPSTLTPFPPPAPLPPPPEPLIIQLRRTISQPVLAAFLAGGVAGAVSRTVVSPLERLKILFQIQSKGREEYKLSVGRGLVKMWKEEGWRGLMRGNGTNCIRIIPYSAVQFASYSFYKRVRETNFLMKEYAIRTRLSIQSASFSVLEKASREKLPGMWTTMLLMYKSEGGILALYRGIVPTVAGVAPYVGLNFMVYEGIRQYFTPEGETNPGHLRRLTAGAISGAVAQSCTYPFDVLRRRFQINTMSGIGYRYKSIWDAITIIFAQEGLKGFYKGIVPNLLKVVPSMASSWLSFEITRDFLVSLGETDR